MTIAQHRRQFLQTSLAAGAVLTLAGGNLGQRGGASQTSPTTRPSADNPRVRPGRVQWHADFAAACAAARTSGKAVLLFHMLGRIDEKFC